MIFAKTPCTIANATGHNEFGKVTLGLSKVSRCAIVKLLTSTDKTSIRTDRSASQGSADEILADARLLFLPQTNIAVDDVVIVRGVKLQVASTLQRFNALTETLDHIEVDLLIWQ